jgi:WD40 repeat protein
MLDITSRGYTTLMRSHTGSIRSVAVDPYRKHIATVSEDNTIRVWDSESLQQVYFQVNLFSLHHIVEDPFRDIVVVFVENTRKKWLRG